MSDDRGMWCEVLAIAVSDALNGAPATRNSDEAKIASINADRRYLTVQNKDFDYVCALAGLDPVPLREKLRDLIDAAPTAAEMVQTPQRRKYRTQSREIRKRKRRTGVGSIFDSPLGTGAGTAAQETPNLTFQMEVVS